MKFFDEDSVKLFRELSEEPASITVRASLAMPMCGRCKRPVDAVLLSNDLVTFHYMVSCHGEMRRVDIDIESLEPGRLVEQVFGRLCEAFPVPRAVHAPLEDDWDSGAWSPVTEGR